MATEILSGASNPSYTNNTGQNVRIVINYMRSILSGSANSGNIFSSIVMSWAGVSASGRLPSASGFAIGRNVASISATTDFRSTLPFSNDATYAYVSSSSTNGNLLGDELGGVNIAKNHFTALPTELMLAPNQRFTATCGVYNIVVIPENG